MEKHDTKSDILNQKDATFAAHLLEFAKDIESKLNEDERMQLDKTAGDQGFVEDAVHFALQHMDRFQGELVDFVKSVKITTGIELFDSIHGGGLFVDNEGNLVIIREEELGFDFATQALKPYKRTYEIMTGPKKGITAISSESPLWTNTVLPQIQQVGLLDEDSSEDVA